MHSRVQVNGAILEMSCSKDDFEWEGEEGGGMTGEGYRVTHLVDYEVQAL